MNLSFEIFPLFLVHSSFTRNFWCRGDIFIQNCGNIISTANYWNHPMFDWKQFSHALPTTADDNSQVDRRSRWSNSQPTGIAHRRSSVAVQRGQVKNTLCTWIRSTPPVFLAYYPRFYNHTHFILWNCVLLGYFAASSGNFYRRFGTTYRSQNPEDETDRLSQNVGKKLPLLAA